MRLLSGLFLKNWCKFLVGSFRFKGLWLVALSTLVEIIFSELVSGYLADLPGAQISTLALLGVIAGILVVNIFLSIVTIALTQWVFRNVQRPEIFEPLPQFLKFNFNQLAIEIIRYIGKIMVWSLLLVIPGLIKFMQYTMVPYIVVFDAKYQRGEVDVFVRARELTRRRLGVIFLVSLLFYILPNAALYFWQLDLSNLSSFVPLLLLKTLFIFIAWLLYTSCLFELFKAFIPEEDFTLRGPYFVASGGDDLGTNVNGGGRA